MTCPRSHSSEWLIGTYAQVCPPARTSEAHVRGWKEALPPPPLVRLCHCPSMTSPARATVWVESWGFQRWPTPPPTHDWNKLYTEPLGRNGGLCRDWPKGHAARGERGEELGRDTLPSSVQPPARALPPPRAEQKVAKRAATVGQASLEEAGALGWLPAATAVAEARASSSNGQTCWRPPLLWGYSLPLCRALCQLPGHRHAWPQVCDLMPGPGGPRWGEL